MPNLVRLYLQQCAIGFALAVLFVGILFVFDVGGLWTLVSNSDVGVTATIMLVMFNAIVFSGAQFAFVIMRMASPDEDTSMHSARPVPPPRTRRTDVPEVRKERFRQRDSA
ncbi:MAG: hypothetical protein QNI90_05790 [Dinoroseobacter sp.]|nr:hypothetical protein [Dinoroseobacter sp.]